jgi:hypothetical protein
MESPLSLIPLGSTIGAAGPVTDSWSLLYRSPPCQLLSYKDVGSALRISHVRKNSPYHHRKDSPCHDKWREKKREKEGSLTPPPPVKAAQSANSKGERNVAQHNVAVLDVRWGRQALRQDERLQRGAEQGPLSPTERDRGT